MNARGRRPRAEADAVLPPASIGRAGGVLALSSLFANLLGYAVTLVLSHALLPSDFGAIGALFNLMLIGAVPALAMQLVAARATAHLMRDRAAATAAATAVAGFPGPGDPGGRRSEGADMLALDAELGRVAALLGVGLCLGMLVLAPVLAGFLHLDGVAPAAFLALSLLPTTLVFAAQGMLQGEERFTALSILFLTAAGVRFAGGAVAGLVGWGQTGVMGAMAVGALVAAVVSVRMVPTMLRRPRPGARRALLGRQVGASTVSTAGLLLLFNIDVLLARHFLPAETSGLYAAGSLFAKAAFWAPQFLATLLFPRMTSHAHRRNAVATGLALTVAIGAAILVVVVAAGETAVRLVAGPAYVAVTPQVWIFAALGGVLAVVQLLVYARLAVADRRLGIATWVAATGVCAVVAVWTHDSIAAIAGTALCGATALAILGGVIEWFAPHGHVRAAPPGP